MSWLSCRVISPDLVFPSRERIAPVRFPLLSRFLSFSLYDLASVRSSVQIRFSNQEREGKRNRGFNGDVCAQLLLRDRKFRSAVSATRARSWENCVSRFDDPGRKEAMLRERHEAREREKDGGKREEDETTPRVLSTKDQVEKIIYKACKNIFIIL